MIGFTDQHIVLQYEANEWTVPLNQWTLTELYNAIVYYGSFKFNTNTDFHVEETIDEEPSTIYSRLPDGKYVNWRGQFTYFSSARVRFNDIEEETLTSISLRNHLYEREETHPIHINMSRLRDDIAEVYFRLYNNVIEMLSLVPAIYECSIDMKANYEHFFCTSFPMDQDVLDLKFDYAMHVLGENNNVSSFMFAQGPDDAVMVYDVVPNFTDELIGIYPIWWLIRMIQCIMEKVHMTNIDAELWLYLHVTKKERLG